ncbi:FUSC family protein [Sphingomonas sp. PAMC26645]|uniref:FUSC family protein n=1 Tax=Sphingomonas sp. PAMC26645 TaxID=2565555 RepID=UPI00109E2895|nr:FUSC family protein [Sphingomonas sp. PAMC26645]QCB43274.1 FUSC family protein [Sphingomonas sp. PAMC26645]
MTRRLDLRIHGAILLRAALVLAPTVALAAFESDAAWLQLSIITISTFIGHERSGVAPAGVLLHALAIITVFTVLLISQGNHVLFPLLTALFAMLSVRITVAGAKLRSLGNFTFVPGLYLAMDVFEAHHGRLDAGMLRMLPWLFAGALPTLLLACMDHGLRRPPGTPRPSYFRLLIAGAKGGERISDWVPVVTVAAAVAFATGLVEILPISHGQWVIWSAASVVGGDAAAVRSKWRDRSIGAFVGVPLGFALGLLAPGSRAVYGASVVGSLLTLVAFQSYVLGFGSRCMLVVVAIVVAGGGSYAAAERVENVVLGGLIGFCFTIGVSFFANSAADLLVGGPSRLVPRWMTATGRHRTVRKRDADAGGEGNGDHG